MMGSGDSKVETDDVSCLDVRVGVDGSAEEAMLLSAVCRLNSAGESGPTPADTNSRSLRMNTGEEERYGVDVAENIGSCGGCGSTTCWMLYCTPDRL